MNSLTPNTSTRVAGFWRRLAAVSYDTCVLLGLFLLTTALIVPFTEDHLIKPHNHYFQGLILIIWVSFFCWFWMRGGQTLGMLAWKIRVVRYDGAPLKFADALFRFIFAIPSLLVLGIGLLWMLIDEEHLAIHDRLTKTKIIRV